MKPVFILLIVLGVFVVIALIAFLIHKILKLRLKEEKPTQEQILKEETERLLKPIEDQEVARQVFEYKDDVK